MTDPTRPSLRALRSVEAVLALPGAIEPVRSVRSTILVASVDNLRATGRFDAYLPHLPARFHGSLLEGAAGRWVPVEIAAAHYAACDELGLDDEEQVEMGRRMVKRIGATIVGTALRMAQQVGASPWTLFPHGQRFWRRGYDGGAMAIYKLGPKEARIDLVGASLLESPFYRRAFMGWCESLTGLFCQKLYMHAKSGPEGPHSVTFRAQWV
jgi:hypothetical protein